MEIICTCGRHTGVFLACATHPSDNLHSSLNSIQRSKPFGIRAGVPQIFNPLHIMHTTIPGYYTKYSAEDYCAHYTTLKVLIFLIIFSLKNNSFKHKKIAAIARE